MILLKLNFCSGTLLSICLLGGAFYSCYQIALHLNCALLLPFCNFNLQFVEMITLLLLIHHVGTLHIKKSSKPQQKVIFHSGIIRTKHQIVREAVLAICFVPKDSNFTIFHIILITVLPVRFQKVKLCLPFVLFLGGEKRFCCPLSFWHKSSLPAIVCLFSTTCAAVVTVSGVTTPLHPNHPSIHSTFRSKAYKSHITLAL